MDIEKIAKLCHEANKILCESQGDYSQVSWEYAEEWQKNSAIEGVKFHLSGLHSPEQSHESWLKLKESEGWVYGEIKDPVKKEHPCMRPYNELPEDQRMKDYLFSGIVNSLKQFVV